MWFSSGGTKSVVHTDAVDNVNCVYRGDKELFFVDPKYKDKVRILSTLSDYEWLHSWIRNNDGLESIIHLKCLTLPFPKPIKKQFVNKNQGIDNGYMCVVHSISFQTFFVQAFKIVVDSWKFSMFLLYILWYDWPIFMISSSNELLQQELEYTLLKPDCHSWWISKMQSGCEDTLEEWYAIKFCFKLGKNATNVWNASDCFWTILHASSMSF